MFGWIEARKLREAREKAQVQVNDVHADVNTSKYLPESVKAEFRDILRLRELIPDVSLEALEAARSKFDNLRMALKTPGMEGVVTSCYAEIFFLICDGMDYQNIDAVFNIANLEARLARVTARQDQLIQAIAARGGIQNATPSQRIEWNRLEQMKARFSKLLEVAIQAQDKEAVKSYLNDLAAQIKFCDPNFKLKAVTEKTSIDELKKIYVEYQAALRKIEQDKVAISQMGIEGMNATSEWINPPQIVVPQSSIQTTTAIPAFNTINTTNMTNVGFAPVNNGVTSSILNQADDLKLRDIKAAANQIVERMKLCDQRLNAVDQQRVQQDELMRSLLEQYKNGQNSPAELARLKTQIHSLQKQRVALQKSRAMWENVKSQADNINSLLIQLQAAKTTEDLQNIEALGIGSLESLTMQLKGLIENMNNNLRESDMATNMVNEWDIDNGYSEAIPMLETQEQRSGVIDSLMKEFHL